MWRHGRLGTALAMLVPQLRAQDRVSIVAYAGSAGLVLPTRPSALSTERSSIASRSACIGSNGSLRHFCNPWLARMVSVLLWL